MTLSNCKIIENNIDIIIPAFLLTKPMWFIIFMYA